MRLFIAIQLSDEMKSALTAAMHELKKAGVSGSYVPTQNLHLTLAFIGECKDAAGVKAALQELKYKPFRLSLSEMGAFGDLIWVGMKGNQGLSALVKELRQALDNAGIDYDRKPFKPHITLIRKAAGSWKSVPAPRAEMMVKKVSLMKSDVKDRKRVYTEVFFV